MAKFKLYKAGANYKTESIEKASATVIAAGDLVALDGSDLAILATATSTKVAFAPNGAGAGDLNIEVTVGDDFLLKGTANVVYAESYRGDVCDILSTTQQIDIATSSPNVLQVDASEDAGVVASASNVVVKINKPII